MTFFFQCTCAKKKIIILCHTSAVFGVLPILKSMLLLMFLSERTEHGGNLLNVFAARVGFFSVTRHDLICFVVSPREKSKPEWVWKRGKFSLIRGEYIVFCLQFLLYLIFVNFSLCNVVFS